MTAQRTINEFSTHIVSTDTAPEGSHVYVRGDINGPLEWNSQARCHAGMFLFAPGEKRGYDICVRSGETEEVTESVSLEYTRDERELIPTVAEITELGDGLMAALPPSCYR